MSSFHRGFEGKSRFYESFSHQKSLFVLLAKKNMLDDQHMGCREENFIVFMYALRSIVSPWSGLRNSRDQTIHTFTSSFLGRLCI